MENTNQRVATRPWKANLVSLLCSGPGSGDRGATVATFKECNVLKWAVGFLKNGLWNPSSREAEAGWGSEGEAVPEVSEFGKWAILAADAS